MGGSIAVTRKVQKGLAMSRERTQDLNRQDRRGRQGGFVYHESGRIDTNCTNEIIRGIRWLRGSVFVFLPVWE